MCSLTSAYHIDEGENISLYIRGNRISTNSGTETSVKASAVATKSIVSKEWKEIKEDTERLNEWKKGDQQIVIVIRQKKIRSTGNVGS